MSMTRIVHGLTLTLAIGLFACATAQPVHAQQGLGERIGQQLDQGLDRLGDQLREGWESLRKTVDRMGVQGRVYSRLRWDKHIATAEIDVDVDADEEGTVALRGVLPSAQAKQKAVQLAQDTVGVNRVIDELRVVEPEPQTP